MRLAFHFVWIFVITTIISDRRSNAVRHLVQSTDQFTHVRRSTWSGVLSGTQGEEYGACDLVGVKESILSCAEGLVCVPIISLPDGSTEIEDLSLNERLSLFEIGFQQRGMCVKFPSSSFAYIFSQGSEMLYPLGYFPLEDGNLNSWPFDYYSSQYSKFKTIKDAVFGDVLDCSTSDPVTISRVNYTSEGHCSVAFWFKSSFQNKKNNNTLFQHGKEHSKSAYVKVYIASDEDKIKIQLQNNEGRQTEFTYFDFSSKILNSKRRVKKENWQFVTFVISPSQGKYQLFLDGTMVAEANHHHQYGNSFDLYNDSYVVLYIETGSFDIEEDIQLCSENFDGSIAHLLLFDDALTSKEIQFLYSAYFTSKYQLSGTDIDSDFYTENGQHCVFPALSRGHLVDNCVLVDGEMKCPSSLGAWKSCAFFQKQSSNSTSKVIPSATDKVPQDSVRYSESGKKCKRSAFFDGNLVFGCVEILGSEHCHTGDGVWEKCLPQSSLLPDLPVKERNQIKRYTVYGRSCVFPFEYNREKYEDCAFLQEGFWACRTTTGEVASCAIERHELPSGPAIVNRLTSSNQECHFPQWYDNSSVAECTVDSGMYSCISTDGEEVQCKPQRFTIEGYPCVFPFPYEGGMEYDCVSKNRTETCRTADGIMRICAPSESILDVPVPITDNKNLMRLPSRITISGERCHFPFWNGVNLTTSCVQISSDDPREFCRSSGNELEECYPQRMTIDGKPCSVPFAYRKEWHLDCVQFLNGSYHCPTMNGIYHLCDLSNGVPLFEGSIGSIPERSQEDSDLEEHMEADLE